jgi:phytoene dehydrogenase-like protein
VKLHVLDEWVRYRHARDRWEVSFGRDLQATIDTLRGLAPEDHDELSRLMDGADAVAAMSPPVAHAPEVESLGDRLRDLWQMRHLVGTFAHYRKPMAVWGEEHLKSPLLRAVLGRLVPPETPPLFLLMVLGYLARGWLSRPMGGTAAFRDALIARYQSLGGKAIVNTTVEEVLVREDRARGVRLTDGTMIEADVVVSTASVPETVFRLLAGRYGALDWKARMAGWKLFQPIVLASYGVERTLIEQPPTLIADAIDPLVVGDHRNDYLYLRTYNDDPAFAPPGHTVVQAMVQTTYDWWATRGAQYQHEKDVAAEAVLASIDAVMPGVRDRVRLTDIATPLTYWRTARSWRGAFEGWLPTSNAFTHVPKTLAGLEGFYLAGQWVEPGGGVPLATMSGRHAVEIICAERKQTFRSTRV